MNDDTCEICIPLRRFSILGRRKGWRRRWRRTAGCRCSWRRCHKARWLWKLLRRRIRSFLEGALGKWKLVNHVKPKRFSFFRHNLWNIRWVNIRNVKHRRRWWRRRSIGSSRRTAWRRRTASWRRWMRRHGLRRQWLRRCKINRRRTWRWRWRNQMMVGVWSAYEFSNPLMVNFSGYSIFSMTPR